MELLDNQADGGAVWTDQVFFLGVPGTGKSYRCMRQVEVICRARVDESGDLIARRLVVHDPVGSWRREFNVKHPQTGKRIELEPWREARKSAPLTYIENDNDLLAALEHETDCVFALDELGDVDDAGGDAMRMFRAMCRKRRHRRITIMACSQRPSRIPVEAYAFCSKVFIFRIQYRDDLDRLAGLWPTREAGKQAVETISNLSIQKHQFIMLRMTEKTEKELQNQSH